MICGVTKLTDAEALKELRAICTDYLMTKLPAELAMNEIIGLLQEHLRERKKDDRDKRGRGEHQHIRG